VGNQEHANLLAFHEVQEVLRNAVSDDRVERCKRLIHQQQARLER